MFATITSIVAEGVKYGLPTETAEEVIAFCAHETELLDKRASTPRKPTSTQVENEGFKSEIVAYLTQNLTMLSIKELQEKIPSLAPLSNQRMSHILSSLVVDNKLTKSYVKKTPFFSAKVQ